MATIETGPTPATADDFEQQAAAKKAEADLLAELEKDFKRIKGQKSRQTGGVEGSTMEAICFKNDEHYARFQNGTLSLEPRDANKLYLVFNLIMPRFQKLLGRLTAFNAPFKARPDKNDPQAIEEAEVCDHLLEALDEKVDEISRMRERLDWMMTGGTSVELVTWVPNASLELNPQFSESGELLYKHSESGEVVPESMVQQYVTAGFPVEAFEVYEEVEPVGEVGSEIYGPFNVFIDQSVRSIKDLSPDQWLHIATPRTLGWIEENFEGRKAESQRDISLVSARIDAAGSSASGYSNLKDLLPIVQGTCSQDDPEMALVVQSWQPASTKNPKGRYVCWIPDQQILHAGENPYEEVPAVDFHFKPATTSFWTQGYVTPLISPQRFINKRMSQLGEQANASIYSHLLLGAGLGPEDIPADTPGVIRHGMEEGTPNVARLPPPEIPVWFLESINLAIKLFNDAAGGADLMEDNKFPGQLRGPMALPFMQEILDTQWGPLFNHLGERIARVKQMRLNRVKQFYPPLRTMHYTSKSQKDEVLTFHTEKILRSGTNYNITVERGSLLPEFRSMREGRIVERLRGPLAILYMDERTGRLDKNKIAADLQFGDSGREGRESKYRKLAMEINKMLWEGKQVPPVQPFYDHVSMLDEMEAEMSTTEYLKASPQIQQLFAERWGQHSQFLQAEAQAQQMAIQSGAIQNAVAQATQQAAAQAASMAIENAMGQAQAQQNQPTGEFLARAQADAQGQADRQSQGQRRPSQRARKVTYEEKEG